MGSVVGSGEVPGGFVVLAETGVSVTGNAAGGITGNIGDSPAAASYITGFGLFFTGASNDEFSDSSLVTGNLYAADYTPPTPTMLTTAIGDMGTAFTAAAGCAPDVTELGAGNISGLTLPPGTYKWGTGLDIATQVILLGSATSPTPSTDEWVFEIAQGLTVSANVVLQANMNGPGGPGTGAIPLPQNIYWQVSGSTILNTGVAFEGNILCQTLISLDTGVNFTGRLLAQTAVTLNADTVTAP
jgi:hypothetical protein